MKKIIISEDFKKVLSQMDNYLSNQILTGELNDDILVDPEKHINYLDVSHSNKGHISYLSKERIDKIEKGDKDFWKVKVRYHARPSVALKRLFSEKFRDFFEGFSIKYISIVDKPVHKFEVVKGKDIAKYYHYTNYRDGSGSLGSSCMSRSPENFFDLYVENENCINMVVMLDQHDRVMGRAILWIGEDFKLMDRVYVNNDLYNNYFIQWAKENSVFYKEYNNFRTPKNIVSPNGEKLMKDFIINLDKSEFERFPYLDTFKWFDKVNKLIFNYIPKNANFNKDRNKDEGIRVLADHMGGNHNGDIYTFDDLTGELIGRDEAVFLDYLNANVYYGDVRSSNCLGCYILTPHSKKTDFGDYIFNEEYDHLNDEKKISEYKERMFTKNSKISEYRSPG